MLMKRSLGPQRRGRGESGWEERPPVALGKHRKMHKEKKQGTKCSESQNSATQATPQRRQETPTVGNYHLYA